MKLLKKVLIILLVIVIGTVILFGKRDIPLVELKEKYAQPPSQFMPLLGMEVHDRDEGNPQDSLPIVLLHGTS